MKFKPFFLACATAYGTIGFATMLFMTILLGIPTGWAALHMLGIMMAIPFMAYPFWWMGVSFIAGALAMWVYKRCKQND